MYLSYYNLTEKPFQINADPKFLWYGEKHKEALAMLKYGILDNSGFLFLAGDIGTGKTTLINSLTEQLGDQIIVAIIPDPGLGNIDFFNFIAAAFNINNRFNSKGEFLVYFSHFLHKAHRDNKKVLLIIDESQRLTDEILEEIRLLSNIEKPDAKLINIFFVGQNECKDIFLKMENRALKQRITINYRIDPLTKNETEQYVRHRLKVAGSEKKIFTPKAIRKIFTFSRGYPRLINIICDHCLLAGYVKGKKTISGGIVKECAKELKISPMTVEKKEKKHVKTTETKQEGQQGKKGKKKRKIVGYICLLVLLLLIAGYFHYLYDTKKILVKPVTQIVKIQNKSVQKQLETQFAIFPDQKLIIPFGYNSTELSSDIFEKLDLLASTMSSNPDVGIVIKGYTGQLGDLLYNKKLSGLRANIVKNYLVDKGVSPNKIKTFGIGSVRQIEDGDDIENKKIPERRVEIEFDTNNQ